MITEMMIETGEDNEVMVQATIEDPVFYKLMLDTDGVESRLDLFADVVEIGARMVQRQLDGQEGELIRRELERMQEQLTQATETLLSGAGAGFAEAMGPVFQTISQQLATIGGRLDGVLAVADAKAEVQAERERGTAKGRPFEEAVAEEIDSIARHQGDTCDHVGDAGGLGGRAGDVIIGIDGANGSERGRIVFEAKTGRLTRPEAMRELDRVKESRGADFAVLVVAGDDKIPAGIVELREYGGDKIICTHSDDWQRRGLELAYSLARARVLASRVESDGADVDGAQAAIAQAVQQFDRLRAIKLKATAISTASDELKDMADDMVNGARACLERAIQALRQSE